MAFYRDPNTGQMIALPDVGGPGTLGNTLGNLGGNSVSAAGGPGMGFPALGAGASNLPPPAAPAQPGAQQPSQSIQLSTGGRPISVTTRGGPPFNTTGTTLGMGYPAYGVSPLATSSNMGYPAYGAPPLGARLLPSLWDMAFPPPGAGGGTSAPAPAAARPQATIPRTATALAPQQATAAPVRAPAGLPPNLVQYNVPGSGYRSGQGPIYTAANLGNVMRGLFGR